MKLSKRKAEIIRLMDAAAPERSKWLRWHRYYYEDLATFYSYIIPEQSRVLEIGCGTGELLHRVKPRRGVGIDLSPRMIAQARQQFPEQEFHIMDAEKLIFTEQFDYIILADVVGYFEDVQQAFHALRSVCQAGTRIIITYQNFLWSPVLSLAEHLHLKMPTKKINWLNVSDLENVLNLEGFQVIKTGHRFLFPFIIPGLAKLCNRYLAQLPVLNRLCLTSCMVARPEPVSLSAAATQPSVSVIIPARNEAGNIQEALRRTPLMGSLTEVIFVEGHSTDETLQTIQRAVLEYAGPLQVRYVVQDGKGKGDAVRKGFDLATGDILMILDADLTVPPEDLPKFYEAIRSGKGEFINGSRLVYPMEKDAMQTLNTIANHFFSVVFTWLLGQPIKDTLCGTKVLWAKDYKLIVKNRKFFGEFDPFGDFDLIFGAAKLHLAIVEVPIRYQARTYGTTNISRFRHGWLLIKMVGFALNKIKFV